jgi:hypothetical protein
MESIITVIEVNHNKFGILHKLSLNVDSWLNSNIKANYKILKDSDYVNIDGCIDNNGEL